MKQHTQRFKEAITELGKQQSVLITYTIDNEEVVLGVEEINSATPRYDADLLKSVMKELHLDSNVDIPVGTEINFKYGLLVDGEFEYLDYGNYIVYTSEKKEDTSSYEILCYDKMLYAMKEYEELNITYPCTVIQYINAIATKMGLKVSSNNNKFPNYNTEIAGEFYLSIDEETKERTSLGYTYRDILDDLAEVTASVICINEYDELEVRDIKDTINYKTTEKSKELKIESQLEAPIQLVTLDGKSTQETREGYNLVDFSSKGDFENDVLTASGTSTPETPVEIQSLGDDVNLLLNELISQEKNGLTIEVNSDKSITINGTATAETNLYLVSNFTLKEGTYTLSGTPSSGGSSTYKIQLTGIESTKNDIGSGVTFTNSVEYSNVTALIKIYNGITLDNVTFKPKIQKGTVVTAYSEYGKGTVEIKQSGNNLLDFNVPQNSKATYNKEDGTITINGTGGFALYFNEITLKSGTTYYEKYELISGTITGTNKQPFMSFNSTSNYWLPEGQFLSYTPTEDVNKNGVWVAADTTFDNVVIRIWANIDQSDFEPYKDNNYVIQTTPLRSLPNGVCDTIEEDGIHRRVGSVVLDGSEGWALYSSSDITNRFVLNIMAKDLNMKDSTSNTLCSHYIYNNTGTIDKCFATGHAYAVQIYDKSFTTPEELKTWLSTHNVEVIYELAEEVIEPFDEEQQAVIDSIETFEGVNIISSNTELQIRYAIDQDTIDEEYLKDTNVNFGEVFGPVNAVVLSRSTSDNIYRNDVASINQNGLYEIKISDNQIMNQNNRDTFIQAIFDKLKGLTYGICDFSSTGIMYYDLLDRFNVKVGDNTYSIVMFHDEQNITQGLEENIFAEKPERSETDYTKADKTDQKLNQTNLIVDKQNQQISALITSNTDLQQKTAQLIIDVEGIKGEISDVADVTTTAEGYGTVQLDNISGDSEPIYLKVYPVNEDIIALKPQTDLYPRTDLYPHSREVYFKNTSSQEPYEVVFDIPTDLYQLNGVYDECILSYEAKECYVIHRIGINENGEKYLLETEEIERFDDYPKLLLTEGNYQVYIPAFNMAYIYVRLMAKNIYTDQFATKVELKSTVEQTANSITTSVNQTLTNYDTKTEVNSKIVQTATEINSEVSKKVGEDEVISKINQSAEQVQINAKKISLARKNSKSNWR